MGKQTGVLVQSKINAGYMPPLDEVNAIIDEAVNSDMDMPSIQAIVNVISSAQTQAVEVARAEVAPAGQQMRHMYNYLTAADIELFRSSEAELSNKAFMMTMRAVKIGHIKGAEKSWGHIRDTLLALHPDGMSLDGPSKLKLLREMKTHAEQQKGHFLHGPKIFYEHPADLATHYPAVYAQAYRGGDAPVPITDEMVLCRIRSLMASGGVRSSHGTAVGVNPNSGKKAFREDAWIKHRPGTYKNAMNQAPAFFWSVFWVVFFAAFCHCFLIKLLEVIFCFLKNVYERFQTIFEINCVICFETIFETMFTDAVFCNELFETCVSPKRTSFCIFPNTQHFRTRCFHPQDRSSGNFQQECFGVLRDTLREFTSQMRMLASPQDCKLQFPGDASPLGRRALPSPDSTAASSATALLPLAAPSAAPAAALGAEPPAALGAGPPAARAAEAPAALAAGPPAATAAGLPGGPEAMAARFRGLLDGKRPAAAKPASAAKKPRVQGSGGSGAFPRFPATPTREGQEVEYMGGKIVAKPSQSKFRVFVSGRVSATGKPYDGNRNFGTDSNDAFIRSCQKIQEVVSGSAR